MKSLCVSVILLALVGSLSAAMTTDGLMLELAGAAPGTTPATHWTPTFAATPSTGLLQSDVKVIPGIDDATPAYDAGNQYYTFSQTTVNGGAIAINNAGGGQVEGLDGLVFGVTDTFTYEAWIRPTQFTAGSNYRQLVMGHQRKNGKGFRMNVRSSSSDLSVYQIEFITRDRTGAGQNLLILATSRDIPANEWAHVVVSWDGTALAPGDATLPDAKIHVNSAVRDSSVSTSGTWPSNDFEYDPDPYRSDAFVVGLRDVDGGTAFNDADRWPYVGDMAAVRVYGKALSTDDVLANFGAGRTGVAVPEPATCGLLTLGALALIRRRKS